MDGAKFFKLTLFMVFMVLTPGMSVQVRVRPRPPFQPRPLCLSQFALANQACRYLPYAPAPPPSPPSPPPSTPSPPPPHGHRHGHGHGHGHGHRHRHRSSHHVHEQSPVEQQCCRWVKEVDDQCVCEMLVHMPLFLSKPFHEYTLVVDPTCNVTYQCGGRLRP